MVDQAYIQAEKLVDRITKNHWVVDVVSYITVLVLLAVFLYVSMQTIQC